MSETYYDLLGVSRDASTADVEAAYRERAKETHPDRSDAPDAAERFAAVSRARDVLVDPVERTRYDRLGHEAYVSGRRGIPRPGGHHAGDDGGGSRGDATPDGSHRDRRRRRGREQSGSGPPGTGVGGGTGGVTGEGHKAGGSAADLRGSEGLGGGGHHAAEEPFARRHASRNRSRTWYRPGAGMDGYGTGGPGRTFTRERVVLAAATLALYPVLVAVTFLPGVPVAVNLVVGVCTFALVAYLLSVPATGVLVFGGWTLLAPFGLALARVGLISPLGILAWSFCWIPFVFASVNLLVRRA